MTDVQENKNDEVQTEAKLVSISPDFEQKQVRPTETKLVSISPDIERTQTTSTCSSLVDVSLTDDHTVKDKLHVNDASCIIKLNGANIEDSVTSEKNEKTLISSSNPSAQKWSYPSGRTKLPVPMFDKSSVSIWSILKGCIGKDLSRVSIPVHFNEPLSFLQRVVEYLEYYDLLNKAAATSDPVERLTFVSAFATACMSSTHDRPGKPFNPLLGETYELVRDDLGFRVHCEQVSHHPPICCFHATSENWCLHGSMCPKLKFWGKTIGVEPKGTITLELKQHGEVYTWENPSCYVHNVIVGKIWIEHVGLLEITNHKTSHRAVLNFKAVGLFDPDCFRVEGHILDEKNVKVKYLYGKWMDAFYAVESDVWEAEYATLRKKCRRNKLTSKHKGIDRSSSDISLSDSDSSLVETGATATSNSDDPITTSSSSKSLSTFFSRKFSQKLGSPKTVSSKNFMSVDNDSNDSEKNSELDINLLAANDNNGGECIEPPTAVSSADLDFSSQNLLWNCRPRPSHSKQYFNFTEFALSLNDARCAAGVSLPSTDARLRPDVRLLENGMIDEAAAEKHRLEEKQRAARKQAQYTPRWFVEKEHASTGKKDWFSNNLYWARNWSNIDTIF